jgi:chromosomal replication initiation ATPase DnaA
MTIPRCSPEENATVRRIIAAVTEATGVDETALTSPVRTDRIATARRVAMAAIRAHTTLSLHETGDLFRKDHSTVVCACRAVRADLESAGRMAALFRAVTANFTESAVAAHP